MNAVEQMLLTQLKTKNPQGYNMLIQMMNSGMNPKQALSKMLEEGIVSNDQIQQATNIAGTYTKTQNTNNFKRF